MIDAEAAVHGPPPLSRNLLLLYGFGCALALVIGVTMPWSWVAVVGLALVAWCLARPVAGLTFVISTSALVVRSTEEITPFEVGYFALLGVVMLGWYLDRTATGDGIAWESADRMFGWFLAVCVISVFPAYLYGSDLLKWLRELVPFLFFLPYLIVVRSVRTVYPR